MNSHALLMNEGNLTLVMDPLPTKFSVQYELLRSLIKHLSPDYNIYVYSNYISPEKAGKLRKLNVTPVLKKSGKLSNFIKRRVYPKLNESLLWGVNWFLDLLDYKLGRNFGEGFKMETGIVINLSSTILCHADVFWIQGPPFVEVVESMSHDNFFARVFLGFFKTPLKNASMAIISKMANMSTYVVANSKFVASRYNNQNLVVDEVIYSPADFSEFKPVLSLSVARTRNERYVLTYIGKESDIEAIEEMAQRGVNIVAFGAKIPPGFNLKSLSKKVKFLGHVSESHLIQLYSNAYFVAFPFTNEPFGFIPIEAMLCGTPVLSYNREGPSETILDGSTGWLVETRAEFVSMAVKLWNQKGTGISSDSCIDRGKEFTAVESVKSLNALLKPKIVHEKYSYN